MSLEEQIKEAMARVEMAQLALKLACHDLEKLVRQATAETTAP
jgi:hypothetical protein